MLCKGVVLSLVTRKKTASITAFVALAFLCIAPQRSFLPQGAEFYNINWSQIVVLLASLLCFGLLMPEIRRQRSLRTFLKFAWPLLLYTLVEGAFWIYGYGHRLDPTIHHSYAQSWWFNYANTIILLPLVFFLGYLINWDEKMQMAFVATVFSALTIIVVGEYLYANGISNPIGDVAHYLNTNTDAIWQWSPSFESLRVTGLYRTPTVLATFTLLGMGWALAVRTSTVARTIIFLDSFFILFLTASRIEMIAAVILVLCALITKIQKRGMREWIKRSFVAVVIGVLICGAGAYIYSEQFAHNDTAGILSRMEASDEQTQSLSEAPTSEDFVTRLDQLSSGRISLWSKAFKVLQKHPYGTGMPSGTYLKAHVHNDFLAKYFTEGILGIVLLVMMYAWISGLSDGAYAHDLGLYFAVIFFVVGLVNCLFAHVPILLPFFFFLGLNVSRNQGERAFT